MPILKEGEIDFISNSADQTRRLGLRLGSLLEPGDIICLSGDMGSGKTAFAAGIGAGWGATTPVTSPTYNLVHSHTHPQSAAVLYHLDCYRLQSTAEAATMGLDEILDDHGILLIEWPEFIKSLLPAERLWVEVRAMDTTRRGFNFEAQGLRHTHLLAQFRENTFGR